MNLNSKSKARRRLLLANWWLFVALLALWIPVFGYILPHKSKVVVLYGRRGDMLLDEHVMTWTRRDAFDLMTKLGAEGREAYQQFYLTFDFYIPALLYSLTFASLLSLLVCYSPRLRPVIYLPLAAYLFDFAENVNNFLMARAFPKQPAFLWTVGPWFTEGKFITVLAILVLIPICGYFRLRDGKRELGAAPAFDM